MALVSSPLILLIEDDPSVARMLKIRIEHAGATTQTCSDGGQAMDTIKQLMPDLVLLDILLPTLSGFAILERMRRDPTIATIPVIIMSGVYPSREHLSRLRSHFGVDAFLDKPIDMAAFWRHTHRLIGFAPAHIPKHIDPEATAIPKGSSPNNLAENSQQAADWMLDASREDSQQLEDEVKRHILPNQLLFQGEIRTHHVAQSLGRLWAEKRSGALLLRQGDVKKIIYLRKGDPVCIRSNKIQECLGRILVRERLITKEQCQKSIATMRCSNTPQGEILVSQNALTPGNLRYALQLQLQSKLFDALTWDEGGYRFNPLASVPKPDILLPQNNQNQDQEEWTSETATLACDGAELLAEGVKRGYSTKRLYAGLASVWKQRLYLHTRDLPPMHSADAAMLQKIQVQLEHGVLLEELLKQHVHSEKSEKENKKHAILRTVFIGFILQWIKPASTKKA